MSDPPVSYQHTVQNLYKDRLTARSFSKSPLNPSTSFSIYTLLKRDRLSASGFSVAVSKNEGIARGGGDGDRVGGRGRVDFEGPACEATFAGVGPSTSLSLSESESELSPDDEEDELDEDELEEDEDELELEASFISTSAETC